MTEITAALGVSAYFLGRRIAGQRRKPERVPVAYLYNGVMLPALPEWDREKYPYAYMTTSILSSNPSIYFTDIPLNATYTKSDTGEGTIWGVNSNGVSVNRLQYNYNKSTWLWDYKGASSLVFGHTFKPFWANTDMEKYYSLRNDETGEITYEPTGTIGLEASEPIPVYE